MRNRWYPGRNRKVKVEWDFEDRLVKVTKADGTVVENTYDVDGVLVRTSVNGVATDLLVDTSGGLSHVVAEIDGSGTVTALYVRAGDMLLEEIRGGIAKMYEADGLGSTRSLLDASGMQTDTWSYEAFGTTLSSTGTSASPYRFAGERFVGDVGMYQNRARWLDTRVGRFVTYDHVFPTGYGYGNSDPVNRVDPSGNISAYTVGITVIAVAAGLLIAHGALRIADWWSHGKFTRGPVRDVTVMGDYGWANWWGGFWYAGETYMSSANDMVTSVASELRPGQHINRLSIFDHGDEYQFALGKADVVSLDNFDKYKGIFRRLTPLFAPSGYILLGHCYVGRNKALMKKVADAAGVPVYAGTGLSVMGFPLGTLRFNTGSYVRCEPVRNDCRTEFARP